MKEPLIKSAPVLWLPRRARGGGQFRAALCGVPRPPPKAGEIPPAFAEDAKWRAHKDTDARWAMKDCKPDYGCKNHCKVDVADNLILAATVTAAGGAIADCTRAGAVGCDVRPKLLTASARVQSAAFHSGQVAKPPDLRSE